MNEKNLEERAVKKLTLTVAEAAKMMGLDKVKVYALCKTEDFPSLTIGKRILIPREALENWLNNKATGKGV